VRNYICVDVFAEAFTQALDAVGEIMPLSGGTVVDGDGEILGLIELFDRLFEFTVVVIHKGDTQIV